MINRFLPAGLVGVLLAGLLSSFMANFSATVNAGAAYLVNDLYKKFFNPDADNRNAGEVQLSGFGADTRCWVLSLDIICIPLPRSHNGSSAGFSAGIRRRIF